VLRVVARQAPLAGTAGVAGTAGAPWRRTLCSAAEAVTLDARRNDDRWRSA
jgi:hypothetical protein